MENFFDEIKKYATNSTFIDSIILVGSYASGKNKIDSDIDLVLVTASKEEMLKNDEFINEFGWVLKKQIEYYGACTSIRVWYQDGKEVEFGLVSPSWLQLPLDSGTAKVLSDGYRVLIDKKGYFNDEI